MPEVKLARIIEVIVSVAMLGGIALVGVTERTNVRNQTLLFHSQEVLRTAEMIGSLAKDAETGQRGYLLTGRPEYLEPFRKATAETPAVLLQLKRLVAEDAASRSRIQAIERLMEAKFVDLTHTVKLKETGEGDAALRRVGSGRGKQIMDSLRAEIAALQRYEASRLPDQLVRADGARRRFVAIAVAFTLVAWLLIMWSSRRNVRQQRINAAITKQLRRYVQELEQAHAVETETAMDLMRLNDELTTAKDRVENAMKARAQFTARISHDIRTPLSGIVGMSQLLMQRETDPENREYVLAIHSCANSLTKLLNDVLDLSKAESGKVLINAARLNLYALCLELANLFRPATEEKGVRFEFSYGGDTPHYVVGDEQRLRQVITNLVANAVKFTASGSVGLSVASALTSNGGCRFRIKVTDSGIGIPAERMASIFDPYEQGAADTGVRYGGTGLGLSICKHMAEAMKGSVEAASVYGQGSVFTLTVPLIPAIPDAQAGALPAGGSQTPRPAGADIRVLVADDNRVNQTVCKRILEGMGAVVDVAANGMEALEACIHRRYDLVLMDCNMPEMDGYEATQALRRTQEGRRLRIVALTADATPESRRRCFEVGMDDWLVKPLRLESLQTVLSGCGSTQVA